MESEKPLKTNKRYFLKVYRWALSFLWKYKLPFLLAIGCVAITTLVDVAIPKFIQYLIDSILPEKSMSLLMRTLLILIPMVAAVIVFTAIRNQLDRIITEKSGRDLQFTVLEKLRELGFAHHEKTPAGTTLSLFNNELRAVQRIFRDYFPNIIQQSIFLIITLAILVSMNWKLSLLIVPCFLSYYLIGPYFEKKQSLLAKEVITYKADYNKKCMTVFLRC